MLLQEMLEQPGISEDEATVFRARAEAALERAKLVREALAMEEEHPKTPV